MLEIALQLLNGVYSKPTVGEQCASLLADTLIGIVAILLALPLCFFIPGAFIAWQPAALVIAAVLFLAGLIRGASPPPNLWVKAVCIDFGASVLAIEAMARSAGWQDFAVLVFAVIVPTVAGISLRRRKARKS
jgi:hypothetical protein